MLTAILLVIGAVLVIGSVFPLPSLITEFRIFGYGITHDLWVIGYFVFTYMLIYWFRDRPKPWRPAVVIAAGIGIGSELIQLVTPFRVFDLQDIYLNLFGVALILIDRRAKAISVLREMYIQDEAPA